MRNLDLIPCEPGVYLIRNALSGKVYVGSSSSMRRRLLDHLAELISRRHPNRHLQAAWNKYGAAAFEVEVVELLDTKDRTRLLLTEESWLQFYRSFDRQRGYNIDTSAFDSSSRCSEETRKRLSELQRERMANPEYCARVIAARTGYSHSKETRKKIAKATRERSEKWSTKRGTLQALLKKLVVHDDGCWVRPGTRKNGYGIINIKKKLHRVSNLLYDILVGPIPDTHTLYPSCENKACCNPGHHIPITWSELCHRTRVGTSSGLQQRAETHCPKGHPYDANNTHVGECGKRSCRACNRERMRLVYAARRQDRETKCK